ncbi:MAG TPA: hypothetical protein VFZ21_16175 [Gemmatimonadaceae bacterium]|nr:hypothetical protein [Gemmatimonadaceae bacterium]
MAFSSSAADVPPVSREACAVSDDFFQRVDRAFAGTYAVERELGGGGRSRVFVATGTALKRRVVIKVLSPELVSPVMAAQFLSAHRMGCDAERLLEQEYIALGPGAEFRTGLPAVSISLGFALAPFNLAATR